jgi:poly(beta-D-mannuronate) lyase
MKVAWYSGDTRQSTFDVLVSSSPSGPWTTLLAGRVSSGTTLALESYDVADTSARYVRLVGHGNNVNTWNSVTEVEVWGQ